jgi:2-succinyl-6-hydroxy-2,4-cyclohexadiene-1-carboxylate synthase
MPPTTAPSAGQPGAVLSHEERGAGQRLVLAHGFTQTGRVWGSMDSDLAGDHQVVTVDLPGHGGSAGVRSSLVDGALQLAAAGGRATYVGYSMGARFCLHVALACPEAVESLILISGTAGIDDPGDRRQRRMADGALADRLDPPDPTQRAEPVDQFLRRWMANPMFDGIGPEADGWEERRVNTGPGMASSLRLAGTGCQLPLWEKLGRLDMPVLVITGGRDEKFTRLGRRLAGAVGNPAGVVVVPDAGHAPHLQQPAVVAAAIRAHVARATAG